MSMVEGQNDYLIFQLYFYHNLSNSKENSRISEIKQKNYGEYATWTAIILDQFDDKCNWISIYQHIKTLAATWNIMFEEKGFLYKVDNITLNEVKTVDQKKNIDKKLLSKVFFHWKFVLNKNWKN